MSDLDDLYQSVIMDHDRAPRNFRVIEGAHSRFLNATIRQYGFMIKGLQEVEKNLNKKNIPFFLLTGFPEVEIPKFINGYEIGTIVADFSPLRIHKGWKESLIKNIDIPLYEVDAHNIVPCWIASSKQEYSARTLRPKLHCLLPEYLEEFPLLKKHQYNWGEKISIADWGKSLKTLDTRKETIISAMRRGARDFLEWPFEGSNLLTAIRRIEALSPKRVDPGFTIKDTDTTEDAEGHQGRPPPTPDMSYDIEAFFFGTFRATIAGRPIRHWPSRKGKSLLAFLLYNDSKPIFREALLEIFWPKVFPESARNCLNVTIHHIRQKIQVSGIQKDVSLFSNDCYLINPELRISLDVKRFLSHWNRSRFLQTDNRPGPAVNELELAASIYLGDFIQDEVTASGSSSDRGSF